MNTTNFGKLFVNAVDGQMYAQPLYVQNLSISGGTHNVVFACTESNSVYAFDADTPGVTYWHTNLGAPFTTSCTDLQPTVGITSTPVIDLNSGTIYLDTKLAAGPAHKLHALDITSGQEKFGGPTTIAAGAQFSASLEHQRAGLLLLNGVVYLAFASHCDGGAYHGFVLGYNANESYANGRVQHDAGGHPGRGFGRAALAPWRPMPTETSTSWSGTGRLTGTANYGESMIKLNGSLVVQDYATPSNWSTLNTEDRDFGSGGPVLLPTHYVAGMGKDGNIYMADTTNMGHVGAFAQQFSAQTVGDTVGPSPVYWQGPTQQLLFALHSDSPTKAFSFSGTNFNTTPVGTAAFSFSDRAGGISLSANGTTNGVLWEIGSDSNLRAYDAVNFPKLLWTGSIGTYVKMTCPTVANGKVYVGTSATLGVWGLTNFIYTQIGAPNPVFNWAAGTLLESTNVMGPWVTNSGVSPYTVQPTNTQKFYRVLLKSGPKSKCGSAFAEAMADKVRNGEKLGLTGRFALLLLEGRGKKYQWAMTR